MKFELNYLFKIDYSKNLFFNYLLSNKVRGRSGPIGQSATLLAPIRRDFGDVWPTRARITQVQGPTNEYLVSPKSPDSLMCVVLRWRQNDAFRS